MQVIGQKIPKPEQKFRLGYNSEMSDTFYKFSHLFLLLNKVDLPATMTNCPKQGYFSENPMKVALVLGRLQDICTMGVWCLVSLLAFVCKKRMASVII